MTETIPVDTEELERQIELGVRDATDLAIKNDDDLEVASALLRGIKTVLKRIDETFGEAVKAAHAAHRKILEAKKKHSEPLEKAETALKRRMGKYNQEQEQLRREKEQRLRAAERKREEEARLAQAEELEARGKAKEADEVLDAPIETTPIVVPAAPKPKGVSYRTKYGWRLVDPDKLPRDYMVVNEKAINKVVQALGEKTNIPGIEITKEQVVSARSN